MRHWNRLKATADFYRRETGLPWFTQRGHFYSPLPRLDAGAAQVSKGDEQLLGLDLNLKQQHRILSRVLELVHEFDWPDKIDLARRFHLDQWFFTWADSLSLFGMLRITRPKRIIEIGCGFSSALILDVNDRFPGRLEQLTLIDPNPERLQTILRESDRATTHLLTRPVQEVPGEIFEQLERDDILFVDSSHVAKIGSDVNYIIFQLLPRLRPGVIVHFHDIFNGFEYPAIWIREGRAWNEAYVLRAFLSFNKAFEILLWNAFAAEKWNELVAKRAPRFLENPGGSLWFRRCDGEGRGNGKADRD